MGSKRSPAMKFKNAMELSFVQSYNIYICCYLVQQIVLKSKENEAKCYAFVKTNLKEEE